MKNSRNLMIILNLIVLMVYFNHSIVKNEQLISNGRLVLFELTPVDPRSLMQGDYMDLQYKLLANVDSEYLPMIGTCIVRLDSNGIAYDIVFKDDETSVQDGEQIIKYRSTDEWDIKIGAESFFFQEGEAEKFSNAKYGGLKIDADGKSLLVGLYDGQLKKIE